MAIISSGGAARLANVTHETVQRWIRIGKLKATRTVGGHYRINEQDVKDLICLDPSERSPGSTSAAPSSTSTGTTQNSSAPSGRRLGRPPLKRPDSDSQNGSPEDHDALAAMLA